LLENFSMLFDELAEIKNPENILQEIKERFSSREILETLNLKILN